MSYVKISWSKPLDEEVIPFLKSLPEDLLAYMEEVLQSTTDEIVDWMQSNAPWEDRTGHARASLRADVETAAARIIRLVMYYDNVPYDKYLESMQGGRFSILTPALDYWYPLLVTRVQQAMGGYSPRNRRITYRRISNDYSGTED